MLDLPPASANPSDPEGTQSDEPLGLKHPLQPAQPLGINRQFLVPLGARSLSVLDPSIFQPDTIQADFLDNPFLDSPFFATEASISSSLPLELPSQPEALQRQAPDVKASESKAAVRSPTFQPPAPATSRASQPINLNRSLEVTSSEQSQAATEAILNFQPDQARAEFAPEATELEITQRQTDSLQRTSAERRQDGQIAPSVEQRPQPELTPAQQPKSDFALEPHAASNQPTFTSPHELSIGLPETDRSSQPPPNLQRHVASENSQNLLPTPAPIQSVNESSFGDAIATQSEVTPAQSIELQPGSVRSQENSESVVYGQAQSVNPSQVDPQTQVINEPTPESTTAIRSSSNPQTHLQRQVETTQSDPIQQKSEVASKNEVSSRIPSHNVEAQSHPPSSSQIQRTSEQAPTGAELDLQNIIEIPAQLTSDSTVSSVDQQNQASIQPQSNSETEVKPKLQPDGSLPSDVVTVTDSEPLIHLQTQPELLSSSDSDLSINRSSPLPSQTLEFRSLPINEQTQIVPTKQVSLESTTSLPIQPASEIQVGAESALQNVGFPAQLTSDPIDSPVDQQNQVSIQPQSNSETEVKPKLQTDGLLPLDVAMATDSKPSTHLQPQQELSSPSNLDPSINRSSLLPSQVSEISDQAQIISTEQVELESLTNLLIQPAIETQVSDTQIQSEQSSEPLVVLEPLTNAQSTPRQSSLNLQPQFQSGLSTPLSSQFPAEAANSIQSSEQNSESTLIQAQQAASTISDGNLHANLQPNQPVSPQSDTGIQPQVNSGVHAVQGLSQLENQPQVNSDLQTAKATSESNTWIQPQANATDAMQSGDQLDTQIQPQINSAEVIQSPSQLDDRIQPQINSNEALQATGRSENQIQPQINSNEAVQIDSLINSVVQATSQLENQIQPQLDSNEAIQAASRSEKQIQPQIDSAEATQISSLINSVVQAPSQLDNWIQPQINSNEAVQADSLIDFSEALQATGRSNSQINSLSNSDVQATSKSDTQIQPSVNPAEAVQSVFQLEHQIQPQDNSATQEIQSASQSSIEMQRQINSNPQTTQATSGSNPQFHPSISADTLPNHSGSFPNQKASATSSDVSPPTFESQINPPRKFQTQLNPDSFISEASVSLSSQIETQPQFSSNDLPGSEFQGHEPSGLKPGIKTNSELPTPIQAQTESELGTQTIQTNSKPNDWIYRSNDWIHRSNGWIKPQTNFDIQKKPATSNLDPQIQPQINSVGTIQAVSQLQNQIQPQVGSDAQKIQSPAQSNHQIQRQPSPNTQTTSESEPQFSSLVSSAPPLNSSEHSPEQIISIESVASSDISPQKTFATPVNPAEQLQAQLDPNPFIPEVLVNPNHHVQIQVPSDSNAIVSPKFQSDEPSVLNPHPIADAEPPSIQAESEPSIQNTQVFSEPNTQIQPQVNFEIQATQLTSQSDTLINSLLGSEAQATQATSKLEAQVLPSSSSDITLKPTSQSSDQVIARELATSSDVLSYDFKSQVDPTGVFQSQLDPNSFVSEAFTTSSNQVEIQTQSDSDVVISPKSQSDQPSVSVPIQTQLVPEGSVQNVQAAPEPSSWIQPYVNSAEVIQAISQSENQIQASSRSDSTNQDLSRSDTQINYLSNSGIQNIQEIAQLDNQPQSQSTSAEAIQFIEHQAGSEGSPDAQSTQPISQLNFQVQRQVNPINQTTQPIIDSKAQVSPLASSDTTPSPSDFCSSQTISIESATSPDVSPQSFESQGDPAEQLQGQLNPDPLISADSIDSNRPVEIQAQPDPGTLVSPKLQSDAISVLDSSAITHAASPAPTPAQAELGLSIDEATLANRALQNSANHAGLERSDSNVQQISRAKDSPDVWLGTQLTGDWVDSPPALLDSSLEVLQRSVGANEETEIELISGSTATSAQSTSQAAHWNSLQNDSQTHLLQEFSVSLESPTSIQTQPVVESSAPVAPIIAETSSVIQTVNQQYDPTEQAVNIVLSQGQENTPKEIQTRLESESSIETAVFGRSQSQVELETNTNLNQHSAPPLIQARPNTETTVSSDVPTDVQIDLEQTPSATPPLLDMQVQAQLNSNDEHVSQLSSGSTIDSSVLSSFDKLQTNSSVSSGLQINSEQASSDSHQNNNLEINSVPLDAEIVIAPPNQVNRQWEEPTGQVLDTTSFPGTGDEPGKIQPQFNSMSQVENKSFIQPQTQVGSAARTDSKKTDESDLIQSQQAIVANANSPHLQPGIQASPQSTTSQLDSQDQTHPRSKVQEGLDQPNSHISPQFSLESQVRSDDRSQPLEFQLNSEIRSQPPSESDPVATENLVYPHNQFTIQSQSSSQATGSPEKSELTHSESLVKPSAQLNSQGSTSNLIDLQTPASSAASIALEPPASIQLQPATEPQVTDTLAIPKQPIASELASDSQAQAPANVLNKLETSALEPPSNSQGQTGIQAQLESESPVEPPSIILSQSESEFGATTQLNQVHDQPLSSAEAEVQSIPQNSSSAMLERFKPTVVQHQSESESNISSDFNLELFTRHSLQSKPEPLTSELRFSDRKEPDSASQINAQTDIHIQSTQSGNIERNSTTERDVQAQFDSGLVSQSPPINLELPTVAIQADHDTHPAQPISFDSGTQPDTTSMLPLQTYSEEPDESLSANSLTGLNRSHDVDLVATDAIIQRSLQSAPPDEIIHLSEATNSQPLDVQSLPQVWQDLTVLRPLIQLATTQPPVIAPQSESSQRGQPSRKPSTGASINLQRSSDAAIALDKSTRSDRIPEQWSSLADLVEQKTKSSMQSMSPQRKPGEPKLSSAGSSQQLAEFSNSMIQAQFIETPPIRVTRHQSSTPVINRQDDDPTIEDPSDDVDYLEVVAQAIYHRLRQRMRVEQERHGRGYFGRLPW